MARKVNLAVLGAGLIGKRQIEHVPSRTRHELIRQERIQCRSADRLDFFVASKPQVTHGDKV